MQQPIEEGPGLFGKTDAKEGTDADAGIARPGVAVVPVAPASEQLRQRRGRRRDRRAGRRVSQQSQGDEAALNRVGKRPKTRQAASGDT